jgi:acetamidase/formamidase
MTGTPDTLRRIPRSARLFSYSAEHEPCVQVDPGETVIVETTNAFGDQRFEPGDTLAALDLAQAVEELVGWMVADYGFQAHEAVLLLGQVAEARCAQLVNPKYSYVTKIQKRFLS